ncbi:hypothetical protein B0J11DRAFT_569511 [Dendryphion nanum]|uniref:Uncharacterized protein n=1 Tax=Dendryphion nanum TaxID=256645 RepID=A0A9P9DPL5_9PLEO|nr:hypothetical protein B0J11DRAFT_569511 [Dendryphion nanum]
MLSIKCALVASFALSCIVVAQSTSPGRGASQFMRFDGTVSGFTTYPPGPNCVTDNMGPYNKSYLYVGVNPSWDPNPFFFELYHLATETVSNIGGWTNNDIYNLDFASSAYSCWNSDGNPCRYLDSSYHYVPEILLDLKKSTVKKTKVGDADGYSVVGDEKSYIRNETRRAAVNRVDIASGCSQLFFSWNDQLAAWNESISWTYQISFSNFTGTAAIKTTIAGNTLDLTFQGVRNATYSSSVPNIELITENDSSPGFRYSNDSTIYFRNVSGSWQASPFPPRNQSSTTGTTRLPTSTTGSRSINQPSSTGFSGDSRPLQGILPFFLALGGFIAL